MSEALLEMSIAHQEASLAECEMRSRRAANPRPASIDELAHDLRQPLSVIETLAYYLEITSPDQKVCGHLRHIQAMVAQANTILDQNLLAVTLT